MEISEAISDGSATVQKREEEFIDKLDVDKNAFQKALIVMKNDFAKIKTFKDVAQYFDFFK